MKTLNLNQPRFENGNITETAEWYDSLPDAVQNKIDLIVKLIRECRFVEDRCLELQRVRIWVKETPMGSGGVGQVKVMKSGEIRVQVGFGHSKYNYAKTAII